MPSSIIVDNLFKRYQVGQRFPSLPRQVVGRLVWGAEYRATNRYHWAVNGVSFVLEPGESLGIVGPNGAGKTTILKILSQVTKPTTGKVRVNGRLSALIELGAGFHPDLTGRENIYLNGAILGMRKSEIKARFEQIVEFAGIGEYLDTPVKRYSSGMHARLGFAVAAHVDPQILLVDEVLAVGDHAFQAKCYARMDELRAKGTSLIFVSHNLEAVRRVCDKGLVMYGGYVIFQGSATEAIVAYSNAIRQAARRDRAAVPLEGGLAQRVMTFDAEIQEVRLLGPDGRVASILESGRPATAVADILFHRDVQQPVFALTIRTPDNRVIYDTTTKWMHMPTPDFHAGQRCRVEYAFGVPLLEGEYELGVDVAAEDLSHYYDRLEYATAFWVKGSNGAKGVVDLAAKLAIKILSDGSGQIVAES